MKRASGILGVIMLLFAACAGNRVNPGKPEMSVPENGIYKNQPKTFNQFHNNWDY